MSQKKIEVFVTNTCPYCARAKALLDRKGVTYQVIDLSNDAAGREALVRRAEGRKTVPQIFVDDRPLGGCDDIYALEREGRLDAILGLSP
jgi:glutaredoxin 3